MGMKDLLESTLFILSPGRQLCTASLTRPPEKRGPRPGARCLLGDGGHRRGSDFGLKGFAVGSSKPGGWGCIAVSTSPLAFLLNHFRVCFPFPVPTRGVRSALTISGEEAKSFYIEEASRAARERPRVSRAWSPAWGRHLASWDLRLFALEMGRVTGLGCARCTGLCKHPACSRYIKACSDGDKAGGGRGAKDFSRS